MNKTIVPKAQLAAAMLICQALQPHDPKKLFVNRVAEKTKADQNEAE